jgi:hypothetical protein
MGIQDPLIPETAADGNVQSLLTERYTMNLKTNQFIIMHPRRAASRLALSLVHSADGKIVQKNTLGTIVQVKSWVGRQLSLVPIVRTEEFDVVLPIR